LRLGMIVLPVLSKSWRGMMLWISQRYLLGLN
jgi:hypothetical protein